jgi:hypothetical protein
MPLYRYSIAVRGDIVQTLLPHNNLAAENGLF